MKVQKIKIKTGKHFVILIMVGVCQKACKGVSTRHATYSNCVNSIGK